MKSSRSRFDATRVTLTRDTGEAAGERVLAHDEPEENRVKQRELGNEVQAGPPHNENDEENEHSCARAEQTCMPDERTMR